MKSTNTYSYHFLALVICKLIDQSGIPYHNKLPELLAPRDFYYSPNSMEQSEDSSSSSSSPFTIVLSSLTHQPKTPSQLLIIRRAQKQQKGQTQPTVGECRICLQGDESGQMIRPCKCTGTIQFTHQKCLQMWIERLLLAHAEVQCEFCRTKYDYDCNVGREVSCEQFGLSLKNNIREMLCFAGVYLLVLLFMISITVVLNLPNGPTREKLIPSPTILLIYIAAMIIGLVFMILLAAHFISDFCMKTLQTIKVRSHSPSKYKFIRRTDLGDLRIRI